MYRRLSFHPVAEEHESFVLEWLHKPHVNEWFHGEGLKSTIEGLHRSISGNKPQYDAWVAFCDDEPFGYLMTSTVKDEEANDSTSHFARWAEPGKKMYTLDLLIGESRFLGKGLATPMIEEFIRDKLPDADIIFIDPEASNQKAIHVYERAGFEKLDQFIASWHPVPHWLMRLRLTSDKLL